MITIAHQLVGAALGQDVVLECHSEAFPKSINYWRRDNGETIVHGKLGASVLNSLCSGVLSSVCAFSSPRKKFAHKNHPCAKMSSSMEYSFY